MEKAKKNSLPKKKRENLLGPTGGVVLDRKRLHLLASHREGFYQSLRSMDEVKLGETEPATVLVWRSKKS